MTIDERIEKLTERHESLAQALELFVRDVTGHMVVLADSMKHLSETAIDHERRIQKMERGPA